MLRTIMEGKYSFSSPEWDDISEDAKELIQKLLTVDRSRRFKAEDALMSSFFQQDVIGI
jgi:phosphorylase kinase gamma subunit